MPDRLPDLTDDLGSASREPLGFQVQRRPGITPALSHAARRATIRDRHSVPQPRWLNFRVGKTTLVPPLAMLVPVSCLPAPCRRVALARVVGGAAPAWLMRYQHSAWKRISTATLFPGEDLLPARTGSLARTERGIDEISYKGTLGMGSAAVIVWRRPGFRWRDCGPYHPAASAQWSSRRSTKPCVSMPPGSTQSPTFGRRSRPVFDGLLKLVDRPAVSCGLDPAGELRGPGVIAVAVAPPRAGGVLRS